MMEQFSAIHKAARTGQDETWAGQMKLNNARKHQVKFLFRLETEFQRDNERAVDPCENKAFGESMGDFITIDNVLFPDGLQSVDTRCISFSDLHHLGRCRSV